VFLCHHHHGIPRKQVRLSIQLLVQVHPLGAKKSNSRVTLCHRCGICNRLAATRQGQHHILYRVGVFPLLSDLVWVQVDVDVERRLVCEMFYRCTAANIQCLML